MSEKIDKGAFQVARQLFESELWIKKPSSWKVIWIYILGKVNHADNQVFKRGENFFNFTQEQKLIGIDITKDKVKKFLKYAKKNGMISTTKSTRGIIIKVLKYDKYQTLDNYISTTKSTLKAPQKHHRSTTINKNERMEKVNSISSEAAKTKKSKNFNSLGDLLKNKVQTEKKSPSYHWQEEALEAVKALKAQNRKPSIFKCFKDNPDKSRIALNDCKELGKLHVLYFFKVYNELIK